MKVTTASIPGILVIEPTVFGDERGFFYESYNERVFAQETGIHLRFVQDNHSRSVRNVLRGLHYQIQQPQGKLIRATAGEVYDVAVDIRRSSPTFGEWTALRLSADDKRMLWVPPGFAHGFLVTTEFAEIQYKATDYWAPQFERSLAWNDPALGIPWPCEVSPIVSAKDRQGVPLDRAEVFP